MHRPYITRDSRKSRQWGRKQALELEAQSIVLKSDTPKTFSYNSHADVMSVTTRLLLALIKSTWAPTSVQPTDVLSVTTHLLLAVIKSTRAPTAVRPTDVLSVTTHMPYQWWWQSSTYEKFCKMGYHSQLYMTLMFVGLLLIYCLLSRVFSLPLVVLRNEEMANFKNAVHL